MSKYDIVGILDDWSDDKGVHHWVYLAENGKTYYTFTNSVNLPKEVIYNKKERTLTKVM